MFSLNDTMRYYLCPQPVSMRKGINALCGVVHEQMSRELRNGDVYVFVNKSLNLMKLLHTEDGGPVLYVKRLEAGRFHLPILSSKSCPIRGIKKRIRENFHAFVAKKNNKKTKIMKSIPTN